MSAKNPSSIQVCIKIRPCEPELTSLWQVNDGRSIHLADSHAEPYVFDYVFDEGTNNQEVFDRMAKHIVHACMQGFNGTIFAYGQTSSGKTYTMMGDGQNPGVMVLAAKEIFQQISSQTERDFLLRVGYIEIYNEKIYDLLNKKNQDLKIHEAGNGIVNVNCEETIITSEEDLLRLLLETQLNERSSSSHNIFRIIIESSKSDRSDDSVVIQSVLYLVDMAGGSELADQTGSPVHVNSNIILGNVIKSLSEHVDKKFISFRDSKLTRILQASLCGNALTSVICTMKPSVSKKSQSTLNFATCAQKIRIKPQVNEMDSDASMMKRVDRGIKILKDKLAEEERKNESQLKVQDLERRIKRDMLKIISSTSLSDQRHQKRRRTRTSGSESEILVSSLPALPEESRLPRPSKMSNLPKPMFYPTNALSHRREIAPKTIGVYQSLKEEYLGVPKLLETESAISKPSKIGYIPKIEQESMANCHALQVEVSALTASNQVAKATIEKYEEQVKTLNETIRRLEMENSEAVEDLGLRFESHKTKSKQLENELLSALSEKDSTIEGLQQSLKELSRDVLRNSKEDHMRSMCPDLESSCERICNKCHELERLLPIADVNGLETIACQCDQLRSEIAATRIKLESVQSAFSQASCEVTQKTTDCERLSREISTAQDDFGQLQEKYNTLEQQWISQQLAIETMQAEYNAIQQKYQKLQAEYEQLGKSSDLRCKELQADNTKLQAEIGTLKERVEEAQRKLLEAPSPETLAEKFKTQNQQLKAEISELQSRFNDIQRENDCLSNQLMESVQENDALREELKQRLHSFDVESMKSSGLGTECSEQDNNHELDTDFMEQFVQLSESIQQIKLQHHSGFSRLFRTNKLGQDESLPGLKLCLESAEYLESDASQQEATDSVCLKGYLKRLRFQIVRISQEEVFMEEEDRLRGKISQLEQEVKEQKTVMADDEAVIQEMREQVTCLQSALVEKSLMEEKVGDYQRQIESLQKLNEEMQDQVAKDESSAKEAQENEVATLKAALSELKSNVCDLQAELQSQLKQMQLKDGNIAELQTQIEEMGERCVSMGMKLAELEENERQKQELLDRQALKLSDNLRLIDELQDRSTKAEESLKLEKAEYKKQIEELEESLKMSQEELRMLEKRNRDEINELQLEYMVKMETCESENRAKFRSYCLGLEESKDGYESSVATLKEQLLQAGEELSRVTNRCQAELGEIKRTLEETIAKAEEERVILNAQHQVELEKIRETLKEKLAEAEEKQEKSEAEISVVKATLKEQLSQAEEEREKAASKLEEMESTLEEMKVHNSAMKTTIAELEQSKSDQELSLQKLEKLYDQDQSRSIDQEAQAHEQINNLLEKCEQHHQDLDELRKEKIALESQIQDANNQHSNTLKKLQELETEMASLTEKKNLEKADLEEKLETFNAKTSDLEEKLRCAQLKLIANEDLVSQHERLKVCLTEANDLKDELQKKVERLRSDLLTAQEGISTRDAEIKQLRSELFKALDEKTTASMEQVSLLAQLKEVEEKMSVQEGSFQREVDDLKGSMDELQLKLESLQDVRNNLETGNEELKAKLRNAQNLQSMLEKEQKLCASLRESLDLLEETKTDLAEQIRAKETEVDEKFKELKLGRHRIEELTKECETLRSDLTNQRLNEMLNTFKEKEAAFADLQETSTKQQLVIQTANHKSHEMGLRVQELSRECEQLRSGLQAKERSFRTEKEQLDGTISNLLKDKRNLEEELGKLKEELTKKSEELQTTLKSKESDMEKNKQQLAEKLTILTEKDNENARLKAQLACKEKELASLQEESNKHKLATEAAIKEHLEMIAKLAGECETLRSTVKSRETSSITERERMNGTISSLLEDKRNLEEKFCTVTEIMSKLELELAALQAAKVSGGNGSFESIASKGSPNSGPSASAKKTLDRNAAASLSRKSISFDPTVRKNRRMTAYDEHRNHDRSLGSQ
ncbi:centromere-associated protein E isoform X2 [Drosophila takahashii]|uniref:centromere-associated protein E isoform X2 n=1 Tax=Drosophila takahashii TaxID=29030 RepID=UPI003899386A